ncbi:MAG: hypothetical protein ACYDHW_17320, partial [Syntrophorhabdaceae bacterium]
KNIMRIDPATRVEITQYYSEGDKINQVMKLQRGRVQTISGEEFIKKVSSAAEGNKFEVHTPNAVAGIRGSWQVTSFIQFTTGVVQKTGTGYFYNPEFPGIVVHMTGGFVSFIFGANGTPTPPRPGNEAYLGGEGTTLTGGGGGSGTGGTLLTGGTAGGGIPPIFTPPISVPSVLVGSDTMFGSGANYSVTAVAKFYGSGTTSRPQMWAASITGSVSSTPPASMSLSGDYAYANVTNISYGGNSAWSAKVDGGASSGIGAYKQPFYFNGVAAGTYTTGGGPISGVAAGTVPATGGPVP